MRTKVVRTTLQVFLIDEDDDGDAVAFVALDAIERLGRRGLEDRLASYLAEVDRLCDERALTLNQPATTPALPDEGGL